MTSFRSFEELAQHLVAEGQGDGIELYPQLQFGAVWWIPDHLSGFGQRLRHPWVVVIGYDSSAEEVVVVPRTTTGRGKQHEVLVIPPGVLAQLDLPGRVLLRRRVPIPAHRFSECDFVGYLNEEWQMRLRAALALLSSERALLAKGS